MSGFIKEAGLPCREDKFIENHYTLAVLSKKHDAPRWHYFQQGFNFTVQIETIFILAILTFVLPSMLLQVLCGIGALYFLGSHIAPLVVIARSMFVGKLTKPIHRRSFLYWSYWPIWRSIVGTAALILGGLLGYYFWDTGFWPYQELTKLKYYQDVNPSVVPGAQIQDAGLVHFGMAAALDRSKGGCFKNQGSTYCVAPIVENGELYDGFGGAPRFGSYDYFAIGIDCCNCPNQDFRCGEWDNPIAQGGIRSLDAKSRPFYQLAVDEWTATYRKTSETPLFFEWVQDPKFYYHDLWHYPVHMIAYAIAAVVPFAFFLAMILGKILQLLVSADVCSPLDVPRPPAGLERAWAVCLPGMLDRYHEEQGQLLSIPVRATPGYASMDNAAAAMHGNSAFAQSAFPPTNGPLAFAYAAEEPSARRAPPA